GDPARLIAGEQANQETVDNISRRLGLDRPLIVQYGTFLVNLAQGDLGRSIHSRRPVFQDLMTRLWATAQLALAAMAFAAVGGILLGALAALRPNSIIDTICSFIALLGISLPAFWLALMVMY